MSSAVTGVLLTMRAQSEVATQLTGHLEPARISAWEIRNYVHRADARGAYVVMSRAGAEYERNLHMYNDDVNKVAEVIGASNLLADTDKQRAALAQIGYLWSGPNGFLMGNFRAFQLSRAGKLGQAQRAYVASPSVDSVIELTAKYIAE